MEVEKEFKNFIKVWIIAVACLSYCYLIASKLPKGFLRLFSILPIIYIFILLPLNLNSFYFAGITCFFLVWLANFKLLLFAFDQPPLLPLPPNLFQFIFLACFPIKFRQNSSKPQKTSQVLCLPKPVVFAVKVLVLVVLCQCYMYKHLFHPYIVVVLNCSLTYLVMEMALAITGFLAQALVGIEIEPQFNEPYLSTSLQDFWSRRWNLMVSNILRPTVYLPVRRCASSLISPKWAPLPAVIATFAVSGLMHEMTFFYLTRVTPTWEVMWFFVLQGVCIIVEVGVKTPVKGRWRLPVPISMLLTIGFVMATAGWLYFPQMNRHNLDDMAAREFSTFVNFVKHELPT